jgi:hypothetical protein
MTGESGAVPGSVSWLCRRRSKLVHRVELLGPAIGLVCTRQSPNLKCAFDSRRPAWHSGMLVLVGVPVVVGVWEAARSSDHRRHDRTCLIGGCGQLYQCPERGVVGLQLPVLIPAVAPVRTPVAPTDSELEIAARQRMEPVSHPDTQVPIISIGCSRRRRPTLMRKGSCSPPGRRSPTGC